MGGLPTSIYCSMSATALNILGGNLSLIGSLGSLALPTNLPESL